MKTINGIAAAGVKTINGLATATAKTWNGITITSEYSTAAVNFDGTNDYMLRGADLTGVADSKVGIFSCWVKFSAAGDGALLGLAGNTGNTMSWRRTAGNEYELSLNNTANTVLVLRLTSNSLWTSASGWHHVLASWNLATPVTHFYINGVSDEKAGTTEVDSNIGYSRANHVIGADTVAGASKLNGNIADLYFNFAEYIDLSVAGNRAKFISGGRPVNLGATGATPTGTAPIMFFRRAVGAAASTFATNLGTGGNMTITGALTDSTTSPSETTFAEDSFTESALVQLQDRTGDSGVTWLAMVGGISNSHMKIDPATDRVFVDGTFKARYISSIAAPVTDEYDVEGIFYVVTSAGHFGIGGRGIDASSGSYYAAELLADTDQLRLLKRVAGTETVLGTFDVTPLDAGETHTVKLAIRTATKKVYWDDVEVISSTDNAVTGAGRLVLVGDDESITVGPHLTYIVARKA